MKTWTGADRDHNTVGHLTDGPQRRNLVLGLYSSCRQLALSGYGMQVVGEAGRNAERLALQRIPDLAACAIDEILGRANA